jgi:UDP-glucose 4-epimerase
LKILVTGGAGFIGANLVENLLADGYEVCVVDDLSTGYRSNLDKLEIEFIEDSILNKSKLDKIAKNCDSIIHLAALGSVPRSVKDPLKTHQVNVEGTLNILEIARKYGSYTIFSSSSSIYGSSSASARHEDLPTNPMSPYAASKIAGESYFRAYGASYQLPTMIFRFFNVFGPKQSFNHAYAAVIPNFISAVLNDQPIPVEGDGRQTRDFTFVDSVVDTLVMALKEKLQSEKPVNLAMGDSISLLQALSILEELSEKKLEIKYLPTRIGDINKSQSDPTLYKTLFPSIKPCNDAINCIH